MNFQNNLTNTLKRAQMEVNSKGVGGQKWLKLTIIYMFKNYTNVYSLTQIIAKLLAQKFTLCNYHLG